jgi:hypothetical protein
MNRFGIRALRWTTLAYAALILSFGQLFGAPQETSRTPDAALVKTKSHHVPKNPHSKTKTATDDWDNQGGGTTGKNTHSDSWLSTDAVSGKTNTSSKTTSHKPPPNVHPKPMTHVQSKNLK